MLALTTKLAFAGIRARRLQAALTVLVVGAAAGALMLALNVDRVADRPFERTFAATNGAHAWVSTLAQGPDDLSAASRVPGVADSTGDLPWVTSSFEHDGRRYGINLVGVGAELPRVSRPLLVEGEPLSADGVLLEQSFARFLGLAPGDRLSVGGVDLEVSGVVVLARGEAYPQTQPGQALVRRGTLARVAPDASRWAHTIGVRLDDPEATAAFAASLREVLPDTVVDTWQEERDAAHLYSRAARTPLVIFSALLLVAAWFVLATLVGGRVLAQVREIGLLKSAGLTPRQVAGVLLVEQLALGAAGVVLGTAAAAAVTPAFVSRSSALLNASESAPFDPLGTAAVAAGVLALVALFAYVPARRAAGRTTQAILTGGPAPKLRAGRLGRSLPPTLAVGLRSAFAHRARAVLTILALSLSVGTVVATIGMERSLGVAASPPPAPALAPGIDAPAWDPVDDDAGEGDRLRPVVYAFDGVLLFVGLVNLVAVMLLAVRERTRDFALLRAVGLTPRDVAAGFLAGQAAVGALAAVVGIPLGLGLFWLVLRLTGSDEHAYPQWWALALLVPASVAVVAAAAAPLGRRAARLPVAEALRYE